MEFDIYQRKYNKSSESSVITSTGATLSGSGLQCRKHADNLSSNSFTRSSEDRNAPVSRGEKPPSCSSSRSPSSKRSGGAAAAAPPAEPFIARSETMLRSPTIGRSSSKCATGAAIARTGLIAPGYGRMCTETCGPQHPLSLPAASRADPGQYGCTAGPTSGRQPKQRAVNAPLFCPNQKFQTSMAAAADNVDDDESSPTPLLTYHTAANDATTSKSKARPKKGAPPSDFELMSAMMRRVSLLERNVTSQAKEIKLRDERISALDAKLRLLTELEGTHPGCSEILERRCQQLQSQGFLEDYGLIWVGDGASEQPDSPLVRGFNMDFDLVLQRTSALNILAGEGESFVQSTATGAQFAQKDPIQLSLYRNGIVMFEGPFRSYQEHSTQRCMQDLMDGYFPSELQERFPDGVPFKCQFDDDRQTLQSCGLTTNATLLMRKSKQPHPPTEVNKANR
ncbi:UBX domain-containing protein 11 [Liparis tanakae]|uniref:UBX domain-containing protein 11 n=1 Tax=Liparis tanakae TaxID=230148 RepID=A0A4Z2IE59_9TELE|nr:UBX domain-containing protein 11 [Liparis tanakae]